MKWLIALLLLTACSDSPVAPVLDPLAEVHRYKLSRSVGTPSGRLEALSWYDFRNDPHWTFHTKLVEGRELYKAWGDYIIREIDDGDVKVRLVARGQWRWDFEKDKQDSTQSRSQGDWWFKFAFDTLEIRGALFEYQ